MRTVQLGEIATFQAGYGFPNKYQGLEEGDYPFAKVGDISVVARNGDQIISSARNYINKETLPLIRAKPLPEGSIVFAKIGEAIRQNFRAITGCPMLIDNNAMGMVPNPNLVDTKYLFYYMRQLDLYQFTSATSVPALRKSRLESLKIPLPPLAEQQRIAAILDQADALRAKRRAALAKLDTLLQATFLHMFGDPVTNPMRWKEGVVGDVVFAAKDGPHVSPKYSEEGIPFLSTRHIRPGKIFWEDLKFIPPEEAEIHWKKCKPEFGDILYTKGGTTGFAKAIDFHKDFAIWVHIALLKTNQKVVDPLWLENMLNTHYCYAQSQRFTHGIANHDLGLTRMVNIKLYIPPIEEQRIFVDRARKIQSHNQNFNLHTQQLDNLFHALQQRAFKGEL